MNKKGYIYIIIIYGIQAFNITLNILLIKFLTLEQLGTVTMAKVYFQFMDYSHLGMRMAIDRLSPIQTLQDNKITVKIAFFITFFVSIIYILFIYLFISQDIIILLFMIAGMFFALGNIFKAYYRAKESFTNMVIMTIIIAFIPLIGQLFFLFFYGYKGFIYGTFFLYILIFIIYMKYFNIFKNIKFYKINNKTKSMFNVGGLLFVNSIIVFIAFSIDKILLEYFKGRDVLGEYAIILFAFSMFLIIPNALAELLFPKIIKDIEKGIDTKIFKYILYLLLPTILFLLIANVTMDYIIENFMIKYISYLKNLHLISWSVLIFTITPVYYHLLNAHNERVKIIKANLYALLILFSYLFYAVNMEKNIILYFIVAKYIYGISLLICYLYYFYRLKQESLYAL
jgi:O-antigen/teichoic acid export membrane protein